MKPAPEWSLENELCELAGIQDYREALLKLGLVPRANAAVNVEVVQEWQRSGSETYSYVFSLRTGRAPARSFRLKACVAHPGPISLQDVLISWIDRRRLLAQNAVSSPKLYAVGKGVLLEEEIPLAVSEALHTNHSGEILSALLNIAAALAKLKFAPVSAFADVRSRGRDAVYVDFGQDLGPADTASSSPEAIFSQLCRQLEEWSFKMPDAELSDLRDSFNARLSSGLV